MAKYSVLNTTPLSVDSLSTDKLSNDVQGNNIEPKNQTVHHKVQSDSASISVTTSPSTEQIIEKVEPAAASDNKMPRYTESQTFNWDNILNQTFLSAIAAKSQLPFMSDKYDFVYQIGNHYLCVLTQHQHIKVGSSKVPNQIITATKQRLATKLTKRLQHIHHKSNHFQNEINKDSFIHHIGLTSITIQYQDKTYPIEHSFGSIFFQEDCVLDLDDESRVLQIFSLDSFMKIVNLLQTPSDVLSFFEYHLTRLVKFDDYANEITLAKDFLVDPQFFKRAFEVQQKLVEIGLLTKIESRLEKSYNVPISNSAANGQVQESTIELVNKLQTSSQMFKKLLNGVIKRHYQANIALLDEPMKMLIAESMYTRMSIMEEVLDYKHSSREEFAQGYLCHQHSYNTFGHHYVLIVYGLDEDAEYSRDTIRQNYSQLLTDINSQLQDPVMDEYFILGFDMSKRDENGNALVEMDVYHQPGSAMTVMERRLYEQVQALSSYQS